MLNIYKYYTDPSALPGIENYKQNLISAGSIPVMYQFALHIIKGRWPEAEQYIMTDTYRAVQYAKEILKDRWIEAEQYIMKDPSDAFGYVRDILSRDKEWTSTKGHEHGRWKEAEQYIMSDSFWWRNYKTLVGI
jgi:hypothetical protein